MNRFVNGIIWPAMLLVIAAVVFWPSLFNGFTNWDDPAYLMENKVIQSLNGQQLKYVFTHFVEGNYHPLTMLSYAIEYQIIGFQPWLYHLNNLLLHLLNTVLVFLLVRELFSQPLIAFFTALIFCIHPMHVESVAWVAERKDLLYSCFYLLGLLVYLRIEMMDRLEKSHWKSLALVFVLFLLACFSKGMAVTFPLSLVLLDFYRGRLDWRRLFEKAPFFILALIFGLVAIKGQQDYGAVETGLTYSLGDRLALIGYNLWYYLKQFFLPTNLSPFHPIPQTIPGWWMLLLLVPIALLLTASRIRHKLLWQFCLLFFIVHLLLVAQLIPIGSALVAERYTYLAYIGPAIGLSWLLVQGMLTFPDWGKKALITASSLAVLYLGISSFQQCKVWQDGYSLWNQVIARYPNDPNGYEGRGKMHQGQQHANAALLDFQKAVSFRGASIDAHNNLALLYTEAKESALALDHFNLVLAHAPDHYQAYLGRGHLYFQLGQFAAAESDFNQVVMLAPKLADGYANRGATLLELQKSRQALTDLNIALTLAPKHEIALLHRGNYYSAEGFLENGLIDYEQVLEQQPKNAEAHHNMGFIFARLKQFDKAIHCFSKAIENNPDYLLAYKNRGLANAKLDQFDQAINDYSTAIEIDSVYADAFWFRAKAFANKGNYSAAINDASKAEYLGRSIDTDLRDSWSRPSS